jgi:hypothetical protein
MKLSLDFSHPRPAPARLAWIMLLAGLLAAVAGTLRYAELLEESRAVSVRLAALTPKASGKPATAAKRPDDAAPHPGRALLAADWGGLLTAFERSRPDDIALLALDAEATRGGLQISAEARDQRAMLAYVAGLGRTPGLDQVVLVSHADQEREGEKAVRFNLRAHWRAP